jgi:transcriptional regulator with XRE-family HTH domain
MSLAEAIQKAREKAGITRTELAHRAMVDNSYVTLVEKGSRLPSLHAIDRLADALGVSPLALFMAGASDDERAAAMRQYDSDGSAK